MQPMTAHCYCRTCFKFYCMFYFTCDRSLTEHVCTCKSITGPGAVSEIFSSTMALTLDLWTRKSIVYRWSRFDANPPGTFRDTVTYLWQHRAAGWDIRETHSDWNTYGGSEDFWFHLSEVLCWDQRHADVDVCCTGAFHSSFRLQLLRLTQQHQQQQHHRQGCQWTSCFSRLISDNRQCNLLPAVVMIKKLKKNKMLTCAASKQLAMQR